MLLKIGKMPGRITEVCIEENTTVQEALNIAGYEVEDTSECEIKLDGHAVSLSTAIPEGSGALILSKRIKGARI